MLGRGADNIEQSPTFLMAGCDVEKAKLVGALGIIGFGERDGIARITQINKVYAFDNATLINIQTWNLVISF